MRIYVATGLTLTIVVASVLVVRHLSREKRLQVGDTAAAVEQLQQEVERLTGQVRRSERTAAAAAEAAASAAVRVRDADPSQPSPSAPKAAPVAAPLSDHDALERLVDRFDAEIADPAWSRDAEIAARQYVVGTLPQNAGVKALECRSKMCRSVVVYPDRAAYQAAMNRLHEATVNWPGIISYLPPREGSQGSVEVEEYLFRSGENPLGEIYAQGAAQAAGSP